MPEIPIEPEDILLDKLEQLKCSQNCQNIANYLIFGLGLYCTQCLSQVKQVVPDQITNFSNLSTILTQLIKEYEKANKSQLSHAKISKTQTDKGNAQISKLRKNLNFQIGTLKNRYTQILSKRYQKCLKEHTLQPLEAIYEPDMTATIIMNETQLLLKILDILKISEFPNKQIKYKFIDQNKQPAKIYELCSKQYGQLKDVLKGATQKVKGILQNWKNDIKNE